MTNTAFLIFHPRWDKMGTLIVTELKVYSIIIDIFMSGRIYQMSNRGLLYNSIKCLPANSKCPAELNWKVFNNHCIFSPSGKLVQIEYALAAVAAGAPSVGIKGK